MSEVLTGTLEKLKDIMPNDIGDNRRFSDDDAERYIMLTDRLVREKVENRHHEQEISLVTGTMEYTLDSEFIDVLSVEFSSDGTTYDRELKPVTLDDLDKINYNWRDSGGSLPGVYALIGTPGTPTAKILIWRPLNSGGTQTIKVIGHGIGGTTADQPDYVQGKCHVPLIMAIVMAEEDLNEALNWYARYNDGCFDVRGKSRNRYAQSPVRVR